MIELGPNAPRDALHVHEWGPSDGEALLLVHAGVADGRGWAPVAERLAACGMHCVAPDLRGFGASPDPSTDFRHVDDLRAVLDAAFDGEPAWVAGWSFGGALALELCIDHRDRVRGLVLACSVPFGLDRSAFVHESWEREEALLAAGDVDGAVRNDVATWVAGPDRTIGELDPSLVGYMEQVARDLLERDGRADGEALDGDRDALDRLAAADLPLLVLVAAGDTPCHDDAAVRLAATSPDVRVERIAGAAHMAPLEQPDQVADAIAAFVGLAAR